MIPFIVRFIGLSFLGKAIGKLMYFGTALVVCALLIGAPLLGMLTNPLAPFWLSGQHAVAVNGPSAAAVPTAGAGNAIITPVPVIGGTSAVVARVIAEAMTWLGTRYLWGGCDRRGIDCSCFVRTAWAAGGVQLSRTTTTQVREVAFVPREQIQAGDLVFFNNTCTDCGANPTHVGLALGGGQMIEAGDPVQIASITTGFYAAHYASAGRVVR